MPQPNRYRRRPRRLMAEPNVVPYIDVMLVLLIIFMVTAPLLHLGVDIQLPQASAKSLQNDKQPVLVSIDKNDQIYLTLGKEPREQIDRDELVRKVHAFIDVNPKVSVLVGGDKRVPYGHIMQVLVMLQQAGVPHVGLMSQPAATPDASDDGRK
jgi:biopolymer transport protein TolR